MIVFIRNQRILNFLSGDIQLSEDDAKSFLSDQAVSKEKRGGYAEECRENRGGHCEEEEMEEPSWWR